MHLAKTLIKFSLLLLFLVISPSILFAQLPTPVWANGFGGSGDSKCTGMEVDAQGNVYMCGYFRGTVDFDPSPAIQQFTSKGDADIYVSKYDLNGKLLWVSVMGGSGLDQANSLAIDKSGNVTITGQFSSTDLDANPGPNVNILTSNGAEDAFVIHLNNNGQYLWSKSFGSGGTDRGGNVVTDSNGDVICDGFYSSSVNIDGTTLNSPGGTNGYIVKYNSGGALILAINIGDTGDDACRGLNVDSNNNISVSGYFNGSVNFNPLGNAHPETSAGDETYIAEYDPSGKLIWVNKISGTLYQTGSVICVDNKDNIYLSGAFQSGINFEPNNPGSEISPKGNLSMFIAKYAPNGTFNFVKVMEGTSASAFCYQIAADKDNNIYITGYFSGTIDFNPDLQVVAPIAALGQRDFFVAKYDENGNYKWAFNGGNPGCDQTYGIEIAVDANKSLLLGGGFCNTVDFDPSNCAIKALTAINQICDSFIAKYIQNAPVPSEISSFSISHESSPAVIDKTNALITVTMPSGTNLSNLAPAIAVTNSGVLSPASGSIHDFTKPVDYVVTSGCSSVTYTVNVLKASATVVTPTSNPTVCATTGDDGTTNINGSINTYFPPQGNITLSAGTGSIALGPVPATDAYGNNFGTVPIKSGDLLLIIQMQDATINYSNSTLYGANDPGAGADGLGATGFTDMGNSGKFEYVIATNNVPLTGGTLTFKGSGTANGTVYTYVNAAPTSTRGKRSFQILRLPQYSNLKLSSNISPPPFNGTAGGIIAFNVGGNIDFNGHTIDVSGRGFRGGYSLVKTSVSNISDLYVAQADDDRVSGKGEGIAGTPRYMWDGYNAIDNVIEGLPGGSGGRGAPANAGGGGNDSNSGGGGGANGGSGGNGGLGYQPIGGSTAENGGRPGSVTFTGAVDVTRLVMGGGGGGGHANDALTGVKGGVGGGVVLITAQSVTGNGTILANGGDGAPGVYGGHPDGSGGGGSGGTVIIQLSNPNPSAVLTIQAIGGKGGNTQNDPGNGGVEPHGPGGGGGGGLISYAILSGTVNVDVSGGKSGKTNSGNGITHDAADGYLGVTNKFTIASLPPYLQGSSGTCYPVLVTTMKVANPGNVNAAGDVVHYIITIKNTASAGNAGGVQAYASLPSGISFNSATVTYTGAASGPTTLTNQGTANVPIIGDFNIPAGETVTIDLAAQISCMPSGTYNSNAEAVYLDPTRLSTDANRRITAATNAFSGSNTTYQSGPTGPVPGSNYSGLSSTAEDVIVSGSNVTNNSITPPTVTAFCASGSPTVIVGSTPTGGTGTYTYQWQSSGDNTTFTDIAGATARDYQTPIINTTTYYRREVTSGSCNTPSVSNVVQIIIQPVVGNNTITLPSVASFCTSGDPSVISGSTPTGGNGTYLYQWQSSADNVTFTDISGATTRDYDPAAVTNTTYYRRLVTSSTCNTPLVSNVVTITVVTNAVPVTNNVITPPAVTSFCASGTPQAITGNTPSGGTGSYVYQWQSSADNTTFTDITGATAKDYAPSAITATTYYRRGVTSGSCATPLMSNVVQITVQPVVANNVITAPAVASFCNTGDPSVITGSLPTGGDGNYTYQWQSSTDNVSFNNIPGATAQNYDPTVITVTTYYRRVVASVLCNTPLASNTVAMVINASPAAPVPVASPVLVCAGNAATLAVTSPQAGLTYNWYSSPSKTSILFTGVTYVTNPVNANTTYYVEAVSNSCSSTLASVQVNVTSAPTAPVVVNSQVPTCSGSMATLSVSNPQASLTYNWYTAASGGSAVYTGTDFVTPALTSNTTYYVEAANNGGCTSVSRTPVNVTVNQLPQLTVQGASVCPGSNTTLTATAPNSIINWYNSATGGNIIHTGTSYMVVVNANTSYYAEAVNSTTGCASSARAVVQAQLLQQLPAPVVSKQSSTISSITFQWAAIDGATGYQVSTDNGQTFTDPSSGVDGLTHTITGLQPNEAATIILRATGKASCELSASSTAFTAAAISALGDKIFVANAFTPNGDGKNDRVYVHSDNIKSLKFYVYDQWGELIYTSLRQEDGWDGTYKGTKEPVGVYVYYLEAIMYGGEQVNKKGTITLLR